VVNLSNKPLTNLRVYVDGCEPPDPHAIYIGHPLGDRVGNEQGLITVNPGDGVRPTAYVDIFQEYIEQKIAPARIRLLYASHTIPSQPQFLDEVHKSTVTLRVDSPDPKQALWCKCLLTYDANTCRYRVAMSAE
jgi:hypothetical protein